MDVNKCCTLCKIKKKIQLIIKNIELLAKAVTMKTNETTRNFQRSSRTWNARCKAIFLT